MSIVNTLTLESNRKIKINFNGGDLSSDAGLLSIGCKARDEGFVFEAIVSSTMQKTGFPVRAASE